MRHRPILLQDIASPALKGAGLFKIKDETKLFGLIEVPASPICSAINLKFSSVAQQAHLTDQITSSANAACNRRMLATFHSRTGFERWNLT